MTSTVKELEAIRDSLRAQLQKIYDVGIEAIRDPNKITKFRVRYEHVGSIYDKFHSIHSQIVALVAVRDESELKSQDAFLQEVDDIFYAIKESFHELFSSYKIPSPTHEPGLQAQSTTTRLPKLNLRTFDGTLENWTAFIQGFQHSIHENLSLANIEKFEYLLSCLSGEPLNLIKSLRLSDENYLIAYQKIVDRYENKRELATHYWNKLYSISKLKEESCTGLRNVYNTFKENLDALRALEIKNLENFILFNLLIDKLDPTTRRAFEFTVRNKKGDIPSYEKLCDFVETQCMVLSNEKVVGESKHKSGTFRQKPASLSSLVASSSSQQESCPVCKQSHVIYSCPSFKAMHVDSRFKFIKERKFCVNCLRPHVIQQCRSKGTCQTCHKNHHSLLHFDKSNHAKLNSSVQVAPSTPVAEPVATTTVNSLSGSVPQRRTILSTALVEIRDSQGRIQVIRALLDSGSEASFITAKCTRFLQLEENPDKIQIQGVGAGSTVVSSGSVVCKISPRGGSNQLIPVLAYVIPQVSAIIPSQMVNPEGWDHVKHLQLADPEFYISRHIDLLLGADVFAQILLPGIIVAPNKTVPSALNTIFGWVLSGTFQPSLNNPSESFVNSFHITVSETLLNEEVTNVMKLFWEIEDIPNTSVHSLDDDLCEQLYSSKHQRLLCGRFVVPLPFKTENPTFPESREIALRRFYTIERRLNRDLNLQKLYVDFMRDYLDAGHMELCHVTDKRGLYYIPHHAVLRPDSCSTKLRVVFDASAKTANNQSLNDTLLVGPKLQQNIVDILLKFRLHSVVLIADIKQMYRQIEISPEHQDYQRIIWRFNTSEPLQEYRLKTVTYGVSSAPYLALRTIQQLSVDGQKQFPLASQVLQSDLYVDDVITGCDSESAALQVQAELIQLLQSGGFPLRKWSSNCPTLLQSLPAEHCQTPFSFDTDAIHTLKVLGLQWSPSTDTFSYQFTVFNKPCSKRGILSELARVFDPIGFLTPVTFYVKHLLQQLWRSGIGWDESPPDAITRQWLNYKSEIPCLSQIKIDRQLVPNKNVSCQIHGFCDASLAGYAAAVYLRYANDDSSFTTYLIVAKSKVAPPDSNKLTIPRLELCGAVLLSKLLALVLKIYSNLLQISDVYAWTDSLIVLGWIRSPANRWKTFVANRVAYIQQRISSSGWYHVSSTENPADCASRGLLPSQLQNHPLWWSGPSWLALPESQWPQFEIDSSQLSVNQVNDPEASIQVLVAQQQTAVLDQLFNRFSSLRTLCHVTAYIFRFAHNCKNSTAPKVDPIDASEYHGILFRLVKLVQEQVFKSEILKLKTKQPCSRALRKLNLFLDDKDIIRVGGRLRHSNLSYDHKYPALLPQNHPVTHLIIKDMHQRHSHPGFQTLHHLIRQTFWILSACRVIRRCLSKCYQCFRVNPPTLQPPMADVPSFRLQQLKAFQIVGVDFGGPFTITMNRVRGAKTLKAYLCLFVCLSTRALHLEIVSNLSSDAFLAALRRFIARRGFCKEIHSDCGTNFIGAHRQILEFCQKAASVEHINWKFNPPSAPHFGGIWEAGIKSVKTHLARIIGEQILSFEELHTVFVQIEALLNSRPLSPISSDPNDLQVLTPGHFLTMAPLSSFQEPDLTQIKANRLTRWQLVQQMHQHFWKRWRDEYLHTLQQRAKWTQPCQSVDIGTLVLIKDNQSSPLHWSMGRVTAVHPGSDNIIRVVTLKTLQGVLKRPVVKVCPLPSYDA